jgi:hypothetical protein
MNRPMWSNDQFQARFSALAEEQAEIIAAISRLSEMVLPEVHDGHRCSCKNCPWNGDHA